MRGQNARLLRKLSELPTMKGENQLKREWKKMSKSEKTIFRQEAIDILDKAGKNTKSL